MAKTLGMKISTYNHVFKYKMVTWWAVWKFGSYILEVSGGHSGDMQMMKAHTAASHTMNGETVTTSHWQLNVRSSHLFLKVQYYTFDEWILWWQVRYKITYKYKSIWVHSSWASLTIFDCPWYIINHMTFAFNINSSFILIARQKKKAFFFLFPYFLLKR